MLDMFVGILALIARAIWTAIAYVGQSAIAVADSVRLERLVRAEERQATALAWLAIAAVAAVAVGAVYLATRSTARPQLVT